MPRPRVATAPRRHRLLYRGTIVNHGARKVASSSPVCDYQQGTNAMIITKVAFFYLKLFLRYFTVWYNIFFKVAVLTSRFNLPSSSRAERKRSDAIGI